MSATAPITRYEVCATILGKDGEAHTGFYPVEVSDRADIARELAARYALGGKVKHVVVISVIEIEEEL